MASDSVNYEAVLADLEARKALLDSAISAIRLILGQGGGGGSVPPGGGPQLGNFSPAHDAYIGLSIPDAAKKHLTAVRKKLSTQDLIQGLEAGGMPPLKYTTVYGVLSRRAKQVGDIVNFKGDWALAEWYPGFRKNSKSAKAEGKESEEAEDADAEAEAQSA